MTPKMVMPRLISRKLQPSSSCMGPMTAGMTLKGMGEAPQATPIMPAARIGPPFLNSLI